MGATLGYKTCGRRCDARLLFWKRNCLTFRRHSRRGERSARRGTRGPRTYKAMTKMIAQNPDFTAFARPIEHRFSRARTSCSAPSTSFASSRNVAGRSDNFFSKRSKRASQRRPHVLVNERCRHCAEWFRLERRIIRIGGEREM